MKGEAVAIFRLNDFSIRPIIRLSLMLFEIVVRLKLVEFGHSFAARRRDAGRSMLNQKLPAAPSTRGEHDANPKAVESKNRLNRSIEKSA
jgi:hypothetical protein